MPSHVLWHSPKPKFTKVIWAKNISGELSLNFDTLFNTHPELFAEKGKFRASLALKTIKELGFRSPKEAKLNNYVRVKPYSNDGFISYPELWMSIQNLSAIEGMIAEVDSNRQKAKKLEEEKQEARRIQRVQRIKSNTSQAANEIAKLSGWPIQAVIDALPTKLINDFANNPDSSVKRFILEEAPEWNGKKPNHNDLFYRIDEIKISAVSKQLCNALLLKDHESYLKSLDLELCNRRKIAEQYYNNWKQSKPKWFPDANLKNSSIRAANGENAEHPLQTFNDINRLKDKPVQISIFQKKVSGKISPVTASKLLWNIQALVDNSVSSQLSILLSEYLFSKVEETLNKFLLLNEFDDECVSNEFTNIEWIAFLKTAFYQVLGDNFSSEKAILSAQANVSKLLAKRHLVLAARRCLSELPKNLKEFYPRARAINRELTFIYGPTNSGKTHRALEALKSANAGLYLGPLRLLALEIFDRLNEGGTATSLVTGELVQEIPGATHVSSTIEMVNLGRTVDVAVIDEVQMLGDPERGSAWLQAILGTPARHVILLGSKNALGAMRMLANLTQEPLREVELSRLNELTVSNRPTELKDAPKGAALIVFSRQAVLNLANHMRAKFGRKVSVIYGALSPEVRAEQARQFRSGENDLLVSTDAVSMGLNLPISTVIFTTSTKWNGTREVALDHSLTCQIAGRAGRYGLHESGVVTATDSEDLNFVKKMLEKTIADLEPPYLTGLNLDMVNSISRHLRTTSLSQIIAFFQESMIFEDWAKPSCTQDQLVLAGYLDNYELDIRQKLILSNSPAVEKGSINPIFRTMVKNVVDGVPETLTLFAEGTENLGLEGMENKVKSATLYSWMHYRFPELFPRIINAKKLLSKLNQKITTSLSTVSGRECNECGKTVPWDHAFGKCQDCFNAYRGGSRAYDYDFGDDDENEDRLFDAF